MKGKTVVVLLCCARHFAAVVWVNLSQSCSDGSGLFQESPAPINRALNGLTEWFDENAVNQMIISQSPDLN